MSKLTDKLKNIRFVRAVVYAIVGSVSYPGLNMINKLKIEGTEHLEGLPRKNVLFVSNHQTYFAEVIAFLHIFCAVKWRKRNKLGIPYYLLNPFTSVFFVSAAETMKESWLTRLFWPNSPSATPKGRTATVSRWSVPGSTCRCT